MTVVDQLLENNRLYSQRFTSGDLGAAPALGIAVVACMGARVVVSRILGLQEGKAQFIRRAGVVITEDTIRSLVISQRLLGTTEVILIHHRNCGMLSFRDDAVDAVKEEIERETGIRPPFALEAFPDVEADVRQSIARLRANPFIPHTDRVHGFVYDVATGLLEEVRP
ncbi:MAG: beta-class carbonic anhydrase [Candidatus Dormibacteria bacterium]